MPGVNKVILLGNVGKDPDVRFTQGGTPVATFTLATSESYTDKSSGQRNEKTEWHTIVCWNRLAEIVSEYVRKGRQVYIEGKLQTRDWTDQQGVKHWKTEIVAQTLQLLGRREEGNGGRGAGDDMHQQRGTSSHGAGSEPTGAGRPAFDDYNIGELGPPLDLDDDPLSPGD